MSNVQIVGRQLEALMAAQQEWEKLSMEMKPTAQQQNRMTYLAAKCKMLGNGVPEQDIARATQERLLREIDREDLMPRDARDSVNFAWGARVRECRANGEGTQSIVYTQGPAGGYLVPQSFADRAYETMRQYDQVFDPMFSTVINTDDGRNLPVPAFDDVSTSSVLVSENTETSGNNSAPIANFGNIQLGAYSFRSGLVVMSRELETDSAFPWGALLERVFAKRHARGIGAYLINGSGNGQPTGLITGTLASGGVAVVAAGSGKNDGTGTSSNSVGTQDLAALYGAVNAAYRMKGVFYMNPDSIIALLKLLDTAGRPIIGLLNGLPFLYGCPIAACPTIPVFGTAGANVAAFGSPDYFFTRRGGPTEVRRYTEMVGLPESYSVAYESWMRTDSNLLAPNSSFCPFAVLQQHS